MNWPKASFPKQGIVSVAIAIIAIWMLYILFSVDLSANSLIAATVAKGAGVLMITGLALALYYSSRLRLMLGVLAAALGGVGSIALIGLAFLWLKDASVPAIEGRSTVGFVTSVLVHLFVAWSFLFHRKAPA